MNKSAAIDMDDVIVDFIGGILDAVYTEFGIRIEPDDINEWHISPMLDPIIGYNWWQWLEEHDWLWANFKAVPGAIGSIDRLSREGWDLEIITSKPKWAHHSVYQWLGKWRPSVNKVIILDPKEIKAKHSEAYILIDDKPQNCIDWAYSGRPALLFDRPHNTVTEVEEHHLITRVYSWPDILTTLKSLEVNHGR